MEGFGDNFTELDPAADFLAREQNELAGLEDDLNPATLNSPPEDDSRNSQDIFPSDNLEVKETLELPDENSLSRSSEQNLSSWEMVKEEPQSDPEQKETIMATDATVSPVIKQIREEPEKIKKWREEQKKRLEEKDANEEKKKEEWREAAKRELDEWYRHHEDLITKTKATNRNAEKEFVAEVDDIQPGTEWERISKLCDFNPKSSKCSKDVSRMRSIILQLKQNPKK